MASGDVSWASSAGATVSGQFSINHLDVGSRCRPRPSCRSRARNDHERDGHDDPGAEPLVEDEETDQCTDRGLEAHEDPEDVRRHAAKRRKVAANHRSRADLGRRVSLAHTADETVQRARAAAERERAAQARQDTRTSGDQPPDERDRLADQRDAVADERDQIANRREATLDERDKIANARERTANERDLYADHRDRVADQRDLAADQRDRQTLKDRSN